LHVFSYIGVLGAGCIVVYLTFISEFQGFNFCEQT